MIAARKQARDLCPRITTLEGIFGAPTDDVEENGCRDKLLRYVIAPLPL